MKKPNIIRLQKQADVQVVFLKIKSWAIRRHPNKSRAWIKNKYYKRIGNRDWIFYAESKVADNTKNRSIVTLKRASDTPIVRHIKIKADANPYDPRFSEYFEQRQKSRMKRSRAAQQRP